MVIRADSNFHTIAGSSVVQRNDRRYQEYRKKWNEWPEKGIIGDFPLHMDIEPTNACNLRCPFCATTHNKYKKGFMTERVWRKILDESGKNELYSVKFTFRGEPLLHKDIDKMVAYAKAAGILDVYFNTNALLLDNTTIHNLIDSGLDRISISFEGYTKEVYEKYRVGSNFETVVKNIENLIEIKKELGAHNPLIRIQTVLVPELIDRKDKYAEFWSGYADEVAYLDMKSEEKNPDHRGLIYDWGCHMLWQRMTVTWEGVILPCVHDIFEWMAFEKISHGGSIKEAWKSVQENNYRKIHKRGEAHEIPACDRCPLRENEIQKLMRG